MKRKTIAMDTETETIDIQKTTERLGAKIIGFSASWDGKNAVYLEDKADIREALKEANRMDATTVWHNFKFDTMVLKNAKLPQPKRWECSLIAGRLLNENRPNGLKYLAKKILGVKEPMAFDEAEKQKLLDPDVFREYAMNDARYTYRIWEPFEQQLEAEELTTVYELEKRMVYASLEVEQNGMLVNVPVLKKMATKVNKLVEKLSWDIYKKAGHQFNLRSPQQLAKVLYEELGLPVLKESYKTGKPSTDREAMQALLEEDQTGIIEILMEYRGLDQLAKNFLNSLPKFLDEGGRIHATLNSLGARTGRTSSSSPNLQNIPSRTDLGKELRAGFIAAPGHKLIIADYNQMELNFLAELVKQKTGDSTMFDILQAGEDLHIKSAESMFKKSVSKNDVERKIAKMINFGIVYGITPTGLMRRLRSEGVDVTKLECEQFVNIYFRTYPGVLQYMEYVSELTSRRGYIQNVYKRRRRVAGWDKREQRQAVNYTIQGGCADVAKCGMVALYDEFAGTDVKMIGMVHDELIIEVPEKKAKKVVETVREAMTITPPTFKMPLTVEVNIGDSWAEK